jgi:hypothetical protein
MTKCGFELEVSDGAASVLASLQRQGLTDHEELHLYHCSCSSCDPRPYYNNNGKLFKAQQDYTADGEFITGILEYGSDDFERAVNGIGRALLTTGAECNGDVGNHVHVERVDMSAEANAKFFRLWDRYHGEMLEIAAGPRTSMRSYNGEAERFSGESLWTNTEHPGYHYPTPLASGSLLAWKSATVEFRLWNSVRAPWRIRTHVGLSVAMVEAAKAGADCTKHDSRCLEEVIGDYIDGPTWSGVIRQRYSKGGLAI